MIKLSIHNQSEFDLLQERFSKKLRIPSIEGLQLGEKTKVLAIEANEHGQVSGAITNGPPGPPGFATIGIPWSPEEFVEQAVKLVHPFDWEVRLPPKVAEVISSIAEMGPTELKRYRIRQLAYWEGRAAALEQREKQLHYRLHKDVEAVIASKRVLLFKEMLEAAHYDDMGVVDLLLTGVLVIGTLEKVGIWKPEDKAAKISYATLIQGAEDAQRDAATVRNPTPEDESIWQSTCEEVQEGCLAGPFSGEQLTSRLGKFWVPAVFQGSLK